MPGTTSFDEAKRHFLHLLTQVQWPLPADKPEVTITSSRVYWWLIASGSPAATLHSGRHEERLAGMVMKVFGASSLDECRATYDAVGRGERTTLDEAVERVTAGASPAFWRHVDSKTPPA
ncbi:MAG TPA: hypothetical protein VF618_10455 [Thermoanaerobaculia bacterium]